MSNTEPLPGHVCDWACYVDRFGVDHHSNTPVPPPTWDDRKTRDSRQSA